ncbi:hypothetical protein Goari_023472 [Gossypium aridum]|uniref:Reverse transcriptase domain-containing protein n=1 Tax=Gossypium aridum TaxID=34290 RepID=A0A7J8X345_GOSAI|nr:hypothetical protein [Gossypium aridum]
MEVRKELDNILHHDELLWRQKEKLKTEAVNFFANLYGEHLGTMHVLPSSAFPYLNDLDTSFLNKSLSNEEIKSVIFYMAPLKALGNDEYYTLFYQSQWDHFGVSQSWECFSRFGPISLYYVLYKLVIKIIANQFKVVLPRIIAPEQAKFVIGRNITNNVIIAYEVIHSMRSKYKNGRWMAIKIDLEKAYDRDLWNGVPIQKLRQVRGVHQRYDLILFVQAEEHQAKVIKGVLNKFCESMTIPKGLCEEIEWIVKQFIWVSHNEFQELGIQKLPFGIPKFQELQQAFGIQKNPFGSDPAKNCVHLTTDGFVRNEDSFFAARGFVCNHNEDCIFDFSRYLGMCMVVDAELWGILDGLKLTLQRDYGSVLIQTNNLEPVNAIQDVSLGILIRLLSREFTNYWT